MIDLANILKSILLFHMLPFGFIVAGIKTDLPVGVKAYFFGQVVVAGLILDMIFSSVTSITGAVGAFLALAHEALMLLFVVVCGVVFWARFEFVSAREQSSTTGGSLTDGLDTDRFYRSSRSDFNRLVRVRGEVIIGLFICSLILARVVAITFPTLPSSGASLLSTPEVSVYWSGLFGDDYKLVVQLIKVVRLDLYLVVGLIGVLAMFPFGNGISPKRMKYSYLVTGTLAQIVILPAVLLAVFGLSVFGVTIISPNAPADLVGNFSALAAPIFLLLLVGGAVTREFLRKAEHTYGS
ncbi:hypothetical protein ACFQL1_02870 [Halomicroarcula sp. GCM10025709]|uniref:hypothetical protein n=1 Tax=Haloarcula TaxID=2237 RepID=UPI0024C3F205|nr:hypothetical protein [Halomicroarcula sp. YJ-61-S]